MRFILDNNLSWRIVEVLRRAGYDVIHLREEWTHDVTDTNLMLDICNRYQDAVLITTDGRMFADLLEMSYVEATKLGAFHLGGNNQKMKLLDRYQQVLCEWPDIVRMATETPKPFMWSIPPHRSGKKWRLLDEAKLRDILQKRGLGSAIPLPAANLQALPPLGEDRS